MTGMSPGILKKSESKPIYPTIRIDLEHLPEAKSWKIGEMHEIEMNLKVVGLSQSRYDNSVEFEIHEVEVDSASEDKKEDDEASESSNDGEEKE